NSLIVDKVRPLYEPVGAGIQKLMQMQLDDARLEYESARSRYDTARNVTVGLIAAGILLSLWLGIVLIRAIVRPLNATIGHFDQIAQGNYNNTIDVERQDEVGKVMESLKIMQVKLGFDVNDAKRRADESLRITNALDNASTGIMIADNDLNIIYVNKSVQAILQNAEGDIKKELPNFNAGALLGANIDSFHKKPEHQRQLLKTFTSTYKAAIKIGGRMKYRGSCRLRWPEICRSASAWKARKAS
ncbi:MAG: methyl-accepting chemotaxis protein, partial [Gallionellaceae bacterium]